MCIKEVDTDRDLFKRHGLLMNPKGKQQIACKIRNKIKAILKEKNSVAMILNYKENAGSDIKETEGGNNIIETGTGQENLNKYMQNILRQKTNKRINQALVSQVTDHQQDKGQPQNLCQMVFIW
jgi:hypothetical protein